MATELWFETVERDFRTNGLLKYHPPILFNKDITVLPFGPYDAGNGNWNFRTCFRFEMSDPSLRALYAMMTGSIVFFPAQSNQSAKIVLRRGDSVGFTLLKYLGILPLRYASQPYIVYENVDPNDARQAALDILADKDLAERLAEKLKKSDPLFIPADAELLPAQFADLWLDNKIPDGLFVEGGCRIGGCNSDPSGAGLSMELRMVDSIDPVSTLFYNPSYHLAMWQDLGWMQGLELFPELTNISSPSSGTGSLRVVTGGGSNKITSAIDSSSAGDTILILDNSTYTDEIVIDQGKPVSISSVAAKGDYANYPKLDGEGDHRPIKITGHQPTRNGIVFIGKLVIENGNATSPRKDGGGILIERADQTIISSCLIRDCNAPGIGAALESLPPILGGYGPALFGEGFGGGIAIYHASPGILGCTVENNDARGRGKGIGVFGYSWPTIFDSTIRANGLDSDGGRKDGGGIGIQIAVPISEDAAELVETTKADLIMRWDPEMLGQAKGNYLRIIDSNILSNNAEDDGGGVYISVMSAVLMRRTTVSKNQAKGNGGGIRVTMGSRLVTRPGVDERRQVQECVIQENISNKDSLAVDSKGSGGGGLSARNPDLIDLAATRLADNTAVGWAGGGIYFLSTDEGTDEVAELQGITYDWNDILWDVFGHDKAILSIDAACSFNGNKATKLAGQGNHGKGGGLYALRLLGPRESGNPLPPDKELNGLLKAPPIEVVIEKTSVLDINNPADFADSNRLYLDDQTVPRVVLDSDLTQAEASGKNDFSYPE